MEWQVDVNFKFENNSTHSKVAEYFINYKDKLSYGFFRELISEVSDLSADNVLDHFSRNSFIELFSGIEDVKANDKKIRVIGICSSSCVEVIPEFIKLIALISGKPLASKAIEDEVILTFKYTKSGVSISEKSRWGDDY